MNTIIKNIFILLVSFSVILSSCKKTDPDSLSNLQFTNHWFFDFNGTIDGGEGFDIIKSSAVTVTVSRINFLKPIHNGDIFTIYTEITAIGTSSMTIYVSVEVKDLDTNEEFEVTSAEFKFVAIDKNGKSVNVRSVLRDDISEHIETLLERTK